jgi:hypothetical protein
LSTGKKLFLPNYFIFFGSSSSLAANTRSEDTVRAWVFVLRFRSPLRAIACAEAIRSVTHLVLAPAGRPQQFIHLEPKGRARWPRPSGSSGGTPKLVPRAGSVKRRLLRLSFSVPALL